MNTCSAFRVRILAVRPHSFIASISSVLYGLSICGHLRVSLAIATVLCTVCLHSAINIANDYFDYINDVDSTDSIYQSYVNKTKQTSLLWYKKCFYTFICLSLVIGLYIVCETDYIVMIIGIACLLTTYLYSGGRHPLANMALGEFLSFLFFGPVACCGTYYIQNMNVGNIQLLNSVSMGFLVSCIMLANNIRDIVTDKVANKRTISVRIGLVKSRILYVCFVFVSYWISVMLDNFMVLLSLPYFIFIINRLLKNDAKLVEHATVFVLVYSLLLILQRCQVYVF